MKKTNSKITSSALNKNKQQHLKQKKWLAKINEIKKKKKNWSKITWVAKKWFANKKIWVASENNERNKKFRDWNRKNTRTKKTFLHSKNFISVAKIKNFV